MLEALLNSFLVRARIRNIIRTLIKYSRDMNQKWRKV